MNFGVFRSQTLDIEVVMNRWCPFAFLGIILRSDLQLRVYYLVADEPSRLLRPLQVLLPDNQAHVDHFRYFFGVSEADLYLH